MSQVEWDKEISSSLKEKWEYLIDFIIRLKTVYLDRLYFSNIESFDYVKNIELHGFSDASERAYGCCVYLKFVTKNNFISTSLVAAKSRVTPCKQKLTIPRLELLGNLILSRLIVTALNAFKDEIDISSIYAWSDSKVSLAWIKSISKEFQTFVQNRVVKIRKNLSFEKWNYCPTTVNPADLLTRFDKNIDFSKNSLWWRGPDFLVNEKLVTLNDQKSSDFSQLDSEFEKEIKKEVTNFNVGYHFNSAIENVICLKKYSNVMKLFRVTALIIRFVKNLKRQKKKEQLTLNCYVSAIEISEAKTLWIKANQQHLVNNESYKNLAKDLMLKYDQENIIRCYGRLKNYTNTTPPIMLSRSHHLTELLVLHCHRKVYHNGTKQTLNEFRSEFWINRGRSYVRKILNSCFLCKKLQSRNFKYPAHSNLPEYRLKSSIPFETCGVDYMGPVFVKNVYEKCGFQMYKAFIIIYTCASTRAIILDMVEDGSTSSFINSLRKLIARRGCPKLIISDNGSVFKATENQSFCAERGIGWKFNIEGSPWWGGFWERLVGIVKIV